MKFLWEIVFFGFIKEDKECRYYHPGKMKNYEIYRLKCNLWMKSYYKYDSFIKEKLGPCSRPK